MPVKPIVWVAVFLVFLFAVVGFVDEWLLWYDADHGTVAKSTGMSVEVAAVPPPLMEQPPPLPRLQVAPRLELVRLFDAQTALLNSAGPRPDGGQRIPVEEAMSRLLRRGFPIQGEVGAAGGRVPRENAPLQAPTGAPADVPRGGELRTTPQLPPGPKGIEPLWSVPRPQAEGDAR